MGLLMLILIEARELQKKFYPVKKHGTLADTQIFFMASLPNIGREKAVALLNAYGAPLNALINVDQWPKDVHGLGPKITRKVKDVIHKPYEGSDEAAE